MSWQDFLIKIVPPSAGAAVGAATFTAGGPVAAAAAGAFANKSIEALLNEFVHAKNEQLKRIEAINKDMQSRLIRLEQGMNVLVDGPWRTALLHIQEAANSPHHLNEDITEARKLLLEAHTLSRDDLRSSWIAQDLAAVYALSGDGKSVRRWLASAYQSGLKGLKDQVWQAVKALESETEKHAKACKEYSRKYERLRDIAVGAPAWLPRGLSDVNFADSGPGLFEEPAWVGEFADHPVVTRLADTKMVDRLVQGLQKLFDDLEQLRQACILARIDQRDSPLPVPDFTMKRYGFHGIAVSITLEPGVRVNIGAQLAREARLLNR